MPFLVHEFDSNVLLYTNDHSLFLHQCIHVFIDLCLENHDLALFLSHVDLILNRLRQETLIDDVNEVWNFLSQNRIFLLCTVAHFRKLIEKKKNK